MTYIFEYFKYVVRVYPNEIVLTAELFLIIVLVAVPNTL